jgi:alanine racemase
LSSEAERAGAILTIDLASIVANYRSLRDRVAPAECAAVVKADAYGLGAGRVAPVLRDAGCRTFFVASVDEGIALRRVLDEHDREQGRDGPVAGESAVYVLNGLFPTVPGLFAEHRLRPVLNSLGEIDAWAAFARGTAPGAAAAIHVDTGMSRLGLPGNELAILRDDPSRLGGFRPTHVISHLACADKPDHPLNGLQREAFAAARASLPPAPGSLANSSGIFLGPAYHADLARPGCALHGVSPVPGRPNPMRQVVRLQGKILQVRDIDTPQTVGYGATHRAEKRERIATVAVGYADGYLRHLGNRGGAYVGDFRVPLVGRVSMDLITFDVTGVPEALVRPGETIDLLGPRVTVDELAAAAGTIGYEILTSLGARHHRVYLNC